MSGREDKIILQQQQQQHISLPHQLQATNHASRFRFLMIFCLLYLLAKGSEGKGYFGPLAKTFHAQQLWAGRDNFERDSR